MIQTKDFETQTMFLERGNISVDGCWPVALDIGYSGVKGMSPNSVYCFPAFARKVSGQMLAIGDPGENDIQYRENGVVWNVGSCAQLTVSADDTNDSQATLFGRNRYFSPMFLVLARTGLAVGMMSNQFGDPNGKQLVLQTGLPPAYLKADAVYLKEVLATKHKFEIRIGNSGWYKFDFDLTEDNIRIMSQPMGSLLSAAMDNSCRQVPDANRLFTSNVLILDAGFGTVDIFSVKHREIDTPQSFDDSGMKAVLSETADAIYKKYGIVIPVHAMQRNLHDGTVKVFNHRDMTTKNEPFEDLLQASSEKICRNVIERIKTIYNNLIDYDYLLITGGTGAAWQDQIADYFKGMDSLKIISGTANDVLPHIFSNVRGYYLYQAGLLKQKAMKAQASGDK